MQEATRLVIEDAIRRDDEAAERYQREADDLLTRAVEADSLADQYRARAAAHRQSLTPVRWVVGVDLGHGAAFTYDPRRG